MTVAAEYDSKTKAFLPQTLPQVLPHLNEDFPATEVCVYENIPLIYDASTDSHFAGYGLFVLFCF